MAERQRLNLYIACEELDHTWSEAEALEFDGLWRAGKDIYEIAEWFGRDPDEVAILAIDRARGAHIQRRPGGIYGGGFGRKGRQPQGPAVNLLQKKEAAPDALCWD